jgi:diguanylate cyclase (GGDEF)-like protein
MPTDNGSPDKQLPDTWRGLEHWVHETLTLSPEHESQLLAAIDAVFARYERLWQLQKQHAINSLATTFADRMVRAKTEIVARDRRITDISRHFEGLVAQLTDKAIRDPKTKLINLSHFVERLESFLAFEQRGKWCAVGMVDIAGFKHYNDTLGHRAGDHIIEGVAGILRERVRDDDLLAREDANSQQQNLHGRFGGDEFCFMLANLPSCTQGYSIADRFREAVSRFDWSSLDVRLGSQPIRVDVGVVCLKLGRVVDRRGVVQDLATRLLERADELMYTAKASRVATTAFARVRIEGNGLIDVPAPEPVQAEAEVATSE